MEYLSNKPFVSVVIPVKNAEAFLPRCLESLANLNYPKDKYEVIISDSDSDDRTREIASYFGVQVVNACGPSVCSARNSGFIYAKGEIIAFSDADCVMDKDWILNAVKYFNDQTVCCVGGPSLVPEDETPFGKACGFIFSHRLFTGGSTYGLNFSQVREVVHNPGCNAIYRRLALRRVMPVDERFIEGEDVVMNKALRELGYRFLYTPDTRVWHYRSSTAKRFWRQNFRYAIGRVLMLRESRKLINPLHLVAGFGIPIAAMFIIFSGIFSIPALAVVLFLGIIFLCFFSISGWIKTKSIKVALRVPFAILFLIIPWSLGFMKEFFTPAKGKDRHR
ncbi:glycosyltransferase [bacterium]|nr:MAG: glycosyltransferase [bacterium]